MPRIKHAQVARVTCALALICLYFIYVTPWSPASKPGVQRGSGADVLNLVNMFIGTKNGGDLLKIDQHTLRLQFLTRSCLPGRFITLWWEWIHVDASGMLTKTGMAKASPDCVGEAHGGFASDESDISGFSHMVYSTLNNPFGMFSSPFLQHNSMTPGLAA